MRVLLTGASSSPGFKTLIELAGRGFEVYAVYNTNPVAFESDSVRALKLDLTDFGRVVEVFREVRPDAVVHMAALGDVDLCERDRGLAWRVNVDATRVLVKQASKSGSAFLYLSTDYVFDGERGMYREEDAPNPVNFYGLTKLVAEELVKTLDRSIVVRTSAIYGFGMGRKNFGKYLVEALSSGQEVRALVDQWLSPTLNSLLAKAVVELLERELWGVYHVAGERVSRYDFALRLARRFGFDASLIKPARMEEMKWYARRPRDSSLDCSRARAMLRTEFHSLDYSLEVLHQEGRAGGR